MQNKRLMSSKILRNLNLCEQKVKNNTTEKEKKSRGCWTPALDMQVVLAQPPRETYILKSLRRPFLHHLNTKSPWVPTALAFFMDINGQRLNQCLVIILLEIYIAIQVLSFKFDNSSTPQLKSS